MPYANLPWLNSGPSLFLDAVRSGTEAGLTKRQQDIQAQEAAANRDLASGKLAQALQIAQAKEAQAENNLDEKERFHDIQGNVWQGRNSLLEGRNSLLQDQLGSKDAEFKSTIAARNLEDAIHQQNADSVTNRLKLNQATADARAKALIDKTAKDVSPTVSIGGGKVHVDDPQLQDYLNTPQDSVATNSPSLLQSLGSHLPWGSPAEDTYTTNRVYPDINSLTNKSDLLNIFTGKKTAKDKFQIESLK